MTTEYDRIPPRCAECKIGAAALELVRVNSRRLCIGCANGVIPGGVKMIWGTAL